MGVPASAFSDTSRAASTPSTNLGGVFDERSVSVGLPPPPGVVGRTGGGGAVVTVTATSGAVMTAP